MPHKLLSLPGKKKQVCATQLPHEISTCSVKNQHCLQGRLKPLVSGRFCFKGQVLAQTEAAGFQTLKNRQKQVERRLRKRCSARSMWKASSKHWRHGVHKQGQPPNTWSTIMAQCWSGLLNRCPPTKMTIASPRHGQCNLHQHSQQSNAWSNIMV